MPTNWDAAFCGLISRAIPFIAPLFMSRFLLYLIKKKFNEKHGFFFCLNKMISSKWSMQFNLYHTNCEKYVYTLVRLSCNINKVRRFYKSIIQSSGSHFREMHVSYNPVLHGVYRGYALCFPKNINCGISFKLEPPQ